MISKYKIKKLINNSEIKISKNFISELNNYIDKIINDLSDGLLIYLDYMRKQTINNCILKEAIKSKFKKIMYTVNDDITDNITIDIIDKFTLDDICINNYDDFHDILGIINNYTNLYDDPDALISDESTLMDYRNIIYDILKTYKKSDIINMFKNDVKFTDNITKKKILKLICKNKTKTYNIKLLSKFYIRTKFIKCNRIKKNTLENIGLFIEYMIRDIINKCVLLIEYKKTKTIGKAEITLIKKLF